MLLLLIPLCGFCDVLLPPKKKCCFLTQDWYTYNGGESTEMRFPDFKGSPDSWGPLTYQEVQLETFVSLSG